MDLTLIKLSLERLLEKVNFLEKQNSKFKKRIKKLEKEGKPNSVTNEMEQKPETILIDTKEVLSILGISYNTLRSIVRRKLITPIRINQRRVRYSKKSIYEFIESRSN